MVERIKAISEVFVEHIQNHLDKNQKVVCKICNKTIDEIYDEATKKENHLWIQPGRGKYAVCRAVVTDCTLSRVHYHARETDPVDYKKLEAKMEGFISWDGFMSWFQKHKINFEDTFRIEFKVIK